jgi:hypothetical protein
MLYTLPWYDSRTELGADFDNHPTPYTAQSYDLCHHLGVTNNNDAEQVIANHVKNVAPDLYTRIVFDSENGCFFAYTADENDMKTFVELVEHLVNWRGREN